ncbi:MAG: class I SAM-dependent methyltransferase [Chloroflexota bacterium]|nr:class I SAM-dependent methyltransferase [Dehalococcoidia bacterium]MDW8252270.1 class I SAM-dependent methyltransferase [Chloroflexota bacterium]
MLDTAFVRRSYEEDGPVRFAVRAVAVGLWRSEQLLIERWLRPSDRILDLGCGAGRTTIGLARLGYRRVEGVDLSPRLIAAARQLAAAAGYPLRFTVADALDLPFPDESFDGAIFSFNGLMQIPGRDRRIRALAETRRVLRPDGVFLFTTHDRERFEPEPGFWRAEARRWRKGKRDPRLPEFGGLLFEHEGAETFLHIPDRAEVLACLAEAGLRWVEDHWRPDLVDEPAAVVAFSAPCRLWVARR